MLNVYYRYEAAFYERGGIEITLVEIPIIKTTPRGVWIGWGTGWKKFILNDAKKKWAHPTKEAALESFKCRKRRQIAILQHQINVAELALHAVENMDTLDVVTIC